MKPEKNVFRKKNYGILEQIKWALGLNSWNIDVSYIRLRAFNTIYERNR